MKERFWNFYGQVGARLTRDQSVRTAPKGTPWFVKILDPALFFKADRYLNTLEKIWIDGVIKERHWKQFMEGLEKEWNQNLIVVYLFFIVLLISVQRAVTACTIRILTHCFKTFWTVYRVASSECLISCRPSCIRKQSKKLPGPTTTLGISCWSDMPSVDHRECGKHHLQLTTPAST